MGHPVCRHRSLALIAAPLLVLLACPLLPARAGVLPRQPHATVRVTIQNYAFSPATLTVAPGTTVVWTQKDTAPHTVTSDSGAWNDAGALSVGQTFSHTFTTAGTYPYHCAVHPYMTAKVIVAGGSASTGTSSGGPGLMMAMGPASKTTLTAFTGWYDKHRVLYLGTDTSSQSAAMAAHSNYAPSLSKSLPNADAIYLVTNGRFAGYGAVFTAQPGESDYTPLWQEVLVTWKNPAQAVPLGRDDQITSLAKQGKLTLKMTGTVLNCPIIKVIGSMGY